MDIKYRKNGSDLTIYVYGELDECTASNAKITLDKLLNNNLNSKKVIFDLSGLSFMDSTGIGLLIGRYKKLKTFNIKTYLTGATVTTERIIEIAGLYDIMPKY